MITKQTEKNEKLYDNLYEEATNALRKVEGSTDEEFQAITTLNEYFVHLPDLIGLMKTKPEFFKSKFVILPIDEEFFEINANTREIIVPPSFRKSVGVAGDQVAEVIYFIVDRYFDTMDLNNQNIHIEWTTPNGVDGVSEELIRDIESQPGKIIFGWALHDVITEMPGTVEFAVRFWTTEKNNAGEDIVEYTLRTLPQKITISKGLDIANLNENERPEALSKEAQEFIFNRIVKSVQDNVEEFVAMPELITLYYTYVDINGNVLTKDNIDIKAVNDTGRFELIESYDGRYIVYIGIKKQTGYTTYNIDDIYDESLDYILTKDSQYNKDKQYYCYTSGDYHPIEFNDDGIDNNNKTFEDYFDEENIFEKLAVFEFIPTDGIAQGKNNPILKGITTNGHPFKLQVKHRIGSTTNDKCVIEIDKPGPVDPTADWKNDIYQPIIIEEESVTIGISDTDQINKKYSPYEITTYEWEGEGLSIGEDYNEPIYTIDPNNITGDEWIYSVTPINKLNKVSCKGTNNKRFRITRPPVSFDVNDIITITRDNGNQIKIEVTTNKFSDGFTYYGLYTDQLFEPNLDTLKPDSELSGKGAKDSEGKYSATVTIKKLGSYTFNIKNYVNGKETNDSIRPKVIGKNGEITQDQVLGMQPDTDI